MQVLWQSIPGEFQYLVSTICFLTPTKRGEWVTVRVWVSCANQVIGEWRDNARYLKRVSKIGFPFIPLCGG
jgi:hypothetical protein